MKFDVLKILQLISYAQVCERMARVEIFIRIDYNKKGKCFFKHPSSTQRQQKAKKAHIITFFLALCKLLCYLSILISQSVYVLYYVDSIHKDDIWQRSFQSQFCFDFDLYESKAKMFYPNKSKSTNARVAKDSKRNFYVDSLTRKINIWDKMQPRKN